MKAIFGKFGPKYDYRGAHVTLAWQGRELLGTITDVERNEISGCHHATVRFFCGDPWPIKPALIALNILDRSAS